MRKFAENDILYCSAASAYRFDGESTR